MDDLPFLAQFMTKRLLIKLSEIYPDVAKFELQRRKRWKKFITRKQLGLEQVVNLGIHMIKPAQWWLAANYTLPTDIIAELAKRTKLHRVLLHTQIITRDMLKWPMCRDNHIDVAMSTKLTFEAAIVVLKATSSSRPLQHDNFTDEQLEQLCTLYPQLWRCVASCWPRSDAFIIRNVRKLGNSYLMTRSYSEDMLAQIAPFLDWTLTLMYQKVSDDFIQRHRAYIERQDYKLMSDYDLGFVDVGVCTPNYAALPLANSQK